MLAGGGGKDRNTTGGRDRRKRPTERKMGREAEERNDIRIPNFGDLVR